jgi:hypothetical protein
MEEQGKVEDGEMQMICSMVASRETRIELTAAEARLRGAWTRALAKTLSSGFRGTFWVAGKLLLRGGRPE